MQNPCLLREGGGFIFTSRHQAPESVWKRNANSNGGRAFLPACFLCESGEYCFPPPPGGLENPPSDLGHLFFLVPELQDCVKTYLKFTQRPQRNYFVWIIKDIHYPSNFKNFHQNALRFMHKIAKLLCTNQEILCVTSTVTIAINAWKSWIDPADATPAARFQDHRRFSQG